MKLYYVKMTFKDEPNEQIIKDEHKIILDSCSITSKLLTAKEALKLFNELYAVWGKKTGFDYKCIEIYKSGDNLPKRILI